VKLEFIKKETGAEASAGVMVAAPGMKREAAAVMKQEFEGTASASAAGLDQEPVASSESSDEEEGNEAVVVCTCDFCGKTSEAFKWHPWCTTKLYLMYVL
jgi:hypothetical protein